MTRAYDSFTYVSTNITDLLYKRFDTREHVDLSFVGHRESEDTFIRVDLICSELPSLLVHDVSFLHRQRVSLSCLPLSNKTKQSKVELTG